MHRLSRDDFLFQHDGALAHRAHNTVAFLERERKTFKLSSTKTLFFARKQKNDVFLLHKITATQRCERLRVD